MLLDSFGVWCRTVEFLWYAYGMCCLCISFPFSGTSKETLDSMIEEEHTCMTRCVLGHDIQ